MLKKLFILNTDDNQTWYKTILWWEFRRILYNFLLIVFGIIALTILSFIVKDLWSFFSPPIFFLMWTGLFLFLANVFYTSGWIFQLITRNNKNEFIKRIRPKIFIYGLLFSFGIQLIPSLFTGGYTIFTGERIKSQYADLTTKEPKINDIIGKYKLADLSKRQLNFPDSLEEGLIFQLNQDSTFELNNFPDHASSMSLKDYRIINAKGRWRVEEDNGNWIIPMTFSQTQIVGSDYVELTKSHYYNLFKINKDKPPYEIYIMVGDPDSWEGVTLEKIE